MTAPKWPPRVHIDYEQMRFHPYGREYISLSEHTTLLSEAERKLGVAEKELADIEAHSKEPFTNYQFANYVNDVARTALSQIREEKK